MKFNPQDPLLGVASFRRDQGMDSVLDGELVGNQGFASCAEYETMSIPAKRTARIPASATFLSASLARAMSESKTSV